MRHIYSRQQESKHTPCDTQSRPGANAHPSYLQATPPKRSPVGCPRVFPPTAAALITTCHSPVFLSTDGITTTPTCRDLARLPCARVVWVIDLGRGPLSLVGGVGHQRLLPLPTAGGLLAVRIRHLRSPQKTKNINTTTQKQYQPS